MQKKLCKKVLAAVTGAALVLSTVGCGSTASTSTTTSETPAESVAETPAETDAEEPTTAEETTEASSDSVAGALEGVTLSVGTSGLFAPFSYYDESGSTLIGFDLDFLAALQDLLGFEIEGEVQAMDYSALTTSVAEGKLDIAMAALCATDERKEVMNFSETYCDSGQILAINTETSPADLTSVDMLKSGDYKVAVEKGTASHLYCINAGVPDSAIEVHDEITTAYESLEQGKVDCLIQDTPGMAFYIKTAEGTKLAMVGDEFNQGQAPYAVAISFNAASENPELVDIFNKAIDELTANGTMDELKATWLE